MSKEDIQLPNAEDLLQTLADKIQPLLNPHSALVGIHSGGAWIAERLSKKLKGEFALGLLDSSFYRDDYGQKGLHADTKPSSIPFEVENSQIILIDDVFYTGRTIRAAMNELFDYGRPASITLAVLINRGGRELPITPQIVAAELPLPSDLNLQLLREDDGKFYFELKENF